MSSVATSPATQLISFSSNTFRQQLLKTIIAADLSFRTVEQPEFRALLHMLRPNINIPSATTLRRLVDDNTSSIILQIQKSIPAGVQVHIATNTWTSTNGLAFAGTSIHFINKMWELQEHIISFQPLGGSSHTGIFLAEKLGTLLAQFDLINRVLCVTTDNTSNNTVMARELQARTLGPKWNPEQYHLPCLAHVLALCSKAFMDNLKSQPENDVLELTTDTNKAITELSNFPAGSFRQSVFRVIIKVMI